ncbi:MAG: hypothetical protein EBX37_17620 [Alphaproteobacteria bacterium]|nr:hypothetical protein [Alphaproteobacteria bacterium]
MTKYVIDTNRLTFFCKVMIPITLGSIWTKIKFVEKLTLGCFEQVSLNKMGILIHFIRFLSQQMIIMDMISCYIYSLIDLMNQQIFVRLVYKKLYLFLTI